MNEVYIKIKDDRMVEDTFDKTVGNAWIQAGHNVCIVEVENPHYGYDEIKNKAIKAGCLTGKPTVVNFSWRIEDGDVHVHCNVIDELNVADIKTVAGLRANAKEYARRNGLEFLDTTEYNGLDDKEVHKILMNNYVI